MKKDLLNYSFEEMRKEIQELGWPAFRGDQVFAWLQKGITSFDEMTNLPIDQRQTLKNSYYINALKMVRKQVSSVDGTTKYLFQLEDGQLIESVLMIYRHGVSVCLSTQVGCAMGCSFCASGQEGLIRNLTTAELLGQVLFIAGDQPRRVSHLVLMGSGEPLQNLANVVKLMKIVNHPKGLHISMRHITLSTCGLIPEIRQLALLQLPFNLAISLHAPNDAIRMRLMPVASRYSVHDLVEACEAYARQTGRRITYEYALIKGVNDSVEHMGMLGDLLVGKLCHVNLIPVNPIRGSTFRSTDGQHAQRLKLVLEKKGIPVTIRREMGSDIDAACGQLKRRTLTEPELGE
ncbi:23S rRNA (adenine(2503)-C(2))-methyltransferase RlmN [Anoxynatronum buryatiense]|uniref:Probable dual-specificity RNA methyltransferase RlmN n=1 Tax=Anoxynatronum buryatiense TaxID=489973 RepID=A0AA45WUD9_9CLOT|nr:23S rRNA (adenine(2503)-C(2))-methyltransferase RlmN [Anoxynatronum buryatiense]SMP46891.1 23S rRNA m(2)A-2503 methyltransferase [Anoxynatronum buryatiense]